MKLIELLNKRKNNEDLTEEELAFLKDYDDSVAVHLSAIEKYKTEAESLKVKVVNMDTEIQDKTRILSEKETAIASLSTKVEDVNKVLENTKTTSEAKAEIERMKIEKAKADALKIAEAEKARVKLEAEEANKKVLEELESMRNQLAISAFKEKIMLEKAKRPYASTQLERILTEIPVKGLEKSELMFEAVLDIYADHEKELTKYEASKTAGSDIFTKTQTVVVETQAKEDKTVNKDSDILEIAKKLNFKVRRK